MTAVDRAFVGADDGLTRAVSWVFNEGCVVGCVVGLDVGCVVGCVEGLDVGCDVGTGTQLSSK